MKTINEPHPDEEIPPLIYPDEENDEIPPLIYPDEIKLYIITQFADMFENNMVYYRILNFPFNVKHHEL